MATKQKTVKRKTIPLPPANKVLVAPLSENALKMEFMSSVYPIGFGFTDKGNAVVISYGFADEATEPSVVEHLITPKQLERIIEAGQEVLDNLARHSLGIKTRG